MSKHDYSEHYPNEKVQPKEGDLMLLHFPQVPCEPFRIPVKDIQEAARLYDVLASYDLFQYDHNIKPNYSNVICLNVFEDGEWCSWYDEEGVHDFGDWLRYKHDTNKDKTFSMSYQLLHKE